VKTPFLEETLRMWRDAQKTLPPGADHSEIYKYQERISKRRSAPARRKTSRRKTSRVRKPR
jgi:hypothetical protein